MSKPKVTKPKQYRVKVRRTVEEYLIVLAFDKKDAASRAREPDDEDSNEKVTVLEVVEE